mgnify:CR=1 FL=1
MAKLRKARVEIVDKETQEKEEVDVLTSAECVTFEDGETFQQKLDNGSLRGQQGQQGVQGPKGDKGDSGDGIKVGTSLESATVKGIFFRIID